MRWICLTFAACSFAQSFEVASIKPAPPPAPGIGMRIGCNGGPGSKDPSRWTCQNLTVGNLVSVAYQLKRYQMTDQLQVQGDRFNITATIPDGATRDQFLAMQQNLLKDRFKLSLHFEKKETPGYELVLAKGGARFKEAVPPKETPDDTPRPLLQGPAPRDKDGFPTMPGMRGMIVENDKAHFLQPEFSMEQMANWIGGQLNRPVVDATGLSGKYSLELRWVRERTDAGAAELDAFPTLVTAMQEQLGLKLQPKKATVDVLVIDHVEKTPTEN